MEFTDFEHDERMIARERLPEDRDEKSLRPLTWADYSGQKQVEKLSITACSMALRALVRRHLPVLLQMKWA